MQETRKHPPDPIPGPFLLVPGLLPLVLGPFPMFPGPFPLFPGPFPSVLVPFLLILRPFTLVVGLFITGPQQDPSCCLGVLQGGRTPGPGHKCDLWDPGSSTTDTLLLLVRRGHFGGCKGAHWRIQLGTKIVPPYILQSVPMVPPECSLRPSPCHPSELKKRIWNLHCQYM